VEPRGLQNAVHEDVLALAADVKNETWQIIGAFVIVCALSAAIMLMVL
jgi:hypothetical protein